MGNFFRKCCGPPEPDPNDLRNEVRKNRSATILVIGNVAVGKTALIKCLINGES